jgi:hypothetical protein
MNMYQPDEEFIQDLKEWIKENPFNRTEHNFTSLPAWNKGVACEWGDKISKSTKGVPRKNINQSASAKKNALVRNSTILKCDYCGKNNNLGNHHRYHGVKCKLFTSLT